MNELALGKTRFSFLARLRLVKFSVNVEHARVNKQPSHLHDCPSVTQCLPRQRYRAAPRRIKAYPTVTYRQIRRRGWEELHGKGGRETEALVNPRPIFFVTDFTSHI